MSLAAPGTNFFSLAGCITALLLGGAFPLLPCGALAADANSSSAPVDPNIFVKLAKKAVPSVVNISTLSRVKSPYSLGNPDDLFRKFFEDFFGRNQGLLPKEPPDDESDEDDTPHTRKGKRSLPQAISLGSGFIIDSSGIILTNNHVVAGADEIKIQFTEETNETPTDGEVIGRDPELDVALIRVKSKREMIPLPLGDSDALQVGEYVMAVGNPFGQGHSVTQGIISAKGRLNPEFPIGNYLQTDAPINPGNSGGPLLNLKGEVIGINTAIEARAQGIGFAIPISLVKNILPQLRKKGVVERGYIGILIAPLTPAVARKIGAPADLQAPVVTQVNKGEPADQAGIKPYDVILEFKGKQIHSGNELVAAVISEKVGQTAPILVLRSGKKLNLSLKIQARPGAKEKLKKAPRPKKKAEPPHINTGMTLDDLTVESAKQLGIQGVTSGVVVTEVTPDSSADEAGISRGDVIVEVDRAPIKDVQNFYSVVKEKKDYLLRIRRSTTQGIDNYAVVILHLKSG